MNRNTETKCWPKRSARTTVARQRQPRLRRCTPITLALGIALLGFTAALATGCDEYVAAGDFYSPTVQPADFSPYGYDYDMYDIFTEDI